MSQQKALMQPIEYATDSLIRQHRFKQIRTPEHSLAVPTTDQNVAARSRNLSQKPLKIPPTRIGRMLQLNGSIPAAAHASQQQRIIRSAAEGGRHVATCLIHITNGDGGKWEFRYRCGGRI